MEIGWVFNEHLIEISDENNFQQIALLFYVFIIVVCKSKPNIDKKE